MKLRIPRISTRFIRAPHARQIGTPPGTVIAASDSPQPVVKVISCNETELFEETVTDLSSLKDLVAKWDITWINVEGLGDAEIIEKIGELFGLHKLALEDVVNTHQRAKTEEYDNFIFLVIRMIQLSEYLDNEQISIFIGDKYLISFQEREGDVLEPVRNRLRKSSGQICKRGVDYLAYAIIDTVIDAYYPVLEVYGNRLEDLEDVVMENPTRDNLRAIHSIKRDLIELRRAVWPLREAIGKLTRETHPLIADTTLVFIRDLYDHVIQVIDLIENYREICSDQINVYLSSVSNRMNDVMKTLTIMASLFIPLTFFAGIYGMNFNTDVSPWNMPELNLPYAYPIFWAMILIITVVMVFYFRKKNWM